MKHLSQFTVIVMCLLVVSSCTTANKFMQQKQTMPADLIDACPSPATMPNNADLGQLLNIAITNKKNLLICSSKQTELAKYLTDNQRLLLAIAIFHVK